MFNYKNLLLSLFIFTLFASFFMINSQANVKEYHQKRLALTSGRIKSYVKNKNYAILHKYKYSHSDGYYSEGTYQKHPHNFFAAAGNFRRNALTDFYLPVSRYKSADMGNPQSFVKSPDGHYAFVMYSKKVRGRNIGTSNIVRYDLWKLYQMGFNLKNMDALRRGVKHNAKVRSAIKFGPKINVGHGQSLAYNFHNNTMWYLLMGVNGKKASFVRVNFKTLRPMIKIKFKFSNRYRLSNQLTFDKHGNIYTYIKYLSGRIVIFKGKFVHNRVYFHTIKQGLLHAPGRHTQGMGYNPKANRLYFVSDGAITSIPVNKLGHLKPFDVHTTRFNTNREFEGIAFDKHGVGHILMNRGPELAKINHF
ncbi:hypothetical protein MOO46_05420 [Apilactobacillus apisilvae]|uniref:Extracellular protein n=1 Tax=Apilactobacillus apisilvae TaxID=2923364 RepID=A0ABY4PGK0_9LACO|nr:hypothetical protein [Apilactobacillus apisilvae]UQS84690.1 hypothetical protein MOO46_05420 [Apilactobacillus apisilvae]